MQGTWRSNVTDFAPHSTHTGEVLGELFANNLSQEAREAIGGRIITPTIHEFLRLAGVGLDNLPPLSAEDLIGPASVSALDQQQEAFYFSGPLHPVLVKARKLPTFVTYQDLLNVHGGLGIKQSMATINFKGLVKNLFEDEAVPTFGEPHPARFDAPNARSGSFLHRFAIRRRMAQRAMAGEYRVGLPGTNNANVFNGYGRALLRALYNPTGNRQHLELTMELESMPDLLVAADDSNQFDWNKTYIDARGIGHKMATRGMDSPIFNYLFDVLSEIGAVDPTKWWDGQVSEQAFALAVESLCPLSNKHQKTIKLGHVCDEGIHHQALTRESVQRAKTVVACMREKEAGTEQDEINVHDPGFQQARTQRTPFAVAPEPEW